MSFPPPFMYRPYRVAVCGILLALAACAGETPAPTGVTVDDRVLQTDVITFPMPGKTVEVEGHGEETFLAVGPMEGVSKDRPANGVATMHVFEDRASIVGIQLNIALPDEGMFYEVWAADAGGAPTMPLGHLQSLFGDVRHSLRYEQNVDLQPYPMMVVTLEADDGNPDPSRVIVAKGALKPHTR